MKELHFVVFLFKNPAFVFSRVQLELLPESASLRLQSICSNKCFLFFYYSLKLFLVDITNNKLSERVIKEIPCTIVSNRIKYLGINLINEVKDLYNKNCKMIMKDI